VVIHARGPWRTLDAVEYATLEWVDRFTTTGCMSRSGTCRRLSTSRRIIDSTRLRPWRP